eukprot:3397180-Amphidinium_carterae.1
MEKEEVELLEKLKRSQERHRLAFRQLEDALSSHQNSSTAGGAPSLPTLVRFLTLQNLANPEMIIKLTRKT